MRIEAAFELGTVEAPGLTHNATLASAMRWYNENMESDRERRDAPPEIEDERGNELGYRNVDEEADQDERGSQGSGPGEPPADET